MYADPVLLNGETVSVGDLVAMARQSHLTYQNQDRVILDVLHSGDKVAFALMLHARQNGQPVAVRIIDILTLTDGLVSAMWAVQQPIPA